ncbi:hypothetical protein [Endozoicomonas lisbonensis]|uniref:Transglycosylase SLT domain-containing protein n=1 Tax=Endozoicomonas lisbonensis TaxID=3120522 RepID=A0ABV2SGV8_9GAMM
MTLGEQFERYVLNALANHRLPLSKAAIRLLVMIAAHESGGFRYVKQMGNGPARGLLQMEPIGLEEVRRYVVLRPERFRSLRLPEHLDELIFNTELAIVCARAFFMAKPEPLPDENNIEGLAKYAKQHWNTEAGKARWEDYANAYRELNA